MDNKPYFLALNRIENIGPRTVLKLLKHWPDLSLLFGLSIDTLIKEGVSPLIANAIASFDFHQIEADLCWQEANHNHRLLTWSDKEYPALLKEIHDPPVVLYCVGDITCLKHPTVAVVGTRKPSAIGAETAQRFAYELAHCGVTIVSGLALGIDSSAHRGCLDAKGKTVAVMGTGIDNIYPRKNLELSEQIAQNGVLLSEFPLKSPPNAGHFPRRNRIISGLSSSILVVEAAIRSGSLITARFALEQNRDVLAIPGSIHNPVARGCHQLLQQGAKLVTSSQDVIDELRIEYYDIEVAKPVRVLACENEYLVKYIGFETTTVDQIVIRSGFGVQKIICELAELELRGIIKTVPGGYTRCKI